MRNFSRISDTSSKHFCDELKLGNLASQTNLKMYMIAHNTLKGLYLIHYLHRSLAFTAHT